MISILLPTRKRVKLLSRWFAATQMVTAAPEDIELLIKVDYDDAETHTFLEDIETPFKVRQIPMENKGFLGMTGYLNHLASLAKGDVFVFASDDIYITTPDWDLLALDHIVGMGEYKYYHNGWRVDINPQYVSRRWYDTLGFIAPDDCPFADGFMAAVGRKYGLTGETGITYWRDAEDLNDPEKEKLILSIPMYDVREDDCKALEDLREVIQI